MKIEQNQILNVEDLEDGTVFLCHTESDTFFRGIKSTDIDDGYCIVYDCDTGKYYDDVYNYHVEYIFENAKLVLN